MTSMITSEIAENIDVLVQFGRDGLRPRVFIWEKRRYDITRINASWTEREGLYRQYRFSVQTDGANVYELALDQRELKWRLVRIHMEG